ncbi:MAG: hypothetical protein ACE5E5_01675 [Phycisphaerae bacterium]
MNSKKRITAWQAMGLLLILGAGAMTVVKLREPAVWRERLIDACATANRVIVDLPEPPPDPESDRRRVRTQYVDVHGSEKVQALLSSIELRPNWLNQYLMAKSAIVFRICHDEDVLASVSYHRGSHLRWRDDRWPGDGFLTEPGMAAIETWLTEQGITLTDP